MEEAQLAWVWLSETGRACACVSGRRVSVGPLTTMMYMDGRVDGDIGYGRCVCGLITHQTCVRLRSLSVDVSVDVHTDVSVEVYVNVYTDVYVSVWMEIWMYSRHEMAG